MNKEMSYEDKLKEELELVRCDLHNAYSWLESKQQENKQLKERIDKAINVIENFDKEDIDIWIEQILIYVLEILKGE